MTNLSEGQFDLDGYLFGGEGDPLFPGPGGFDPGVTGWRTQDQLNPIGDATSFGRDLRSPATWAWTMTSNLPDIEQAMVAIEEAETAWMGGLARSTPGAVIPLRYRIAGRTRRVYGRPRRFSHDLNPLAWQGVVNVVCDFARADTLHYDDEARGVVLPIVQANSTTGLMTPLITPLTTVGASEDTVRPISPVGGNAPAPFVAIITGPVTDPFIEGDGWRLKLNLTLAYDQSAIIDTRPWAMTVLRQDGASLAGAVSRDSSMRAARLLPGGSTVRFGGVDPTGTATCAISWRPSYNSL